MNTREKLESIICNAAEISYRKIEDNERLLEDIGIDSIRIVKVIFGIEKEFGFEFDEEFLDYEKIYKFSSLHDYVNSKI